MSDGTAKNIVLTHLGRSGSTVLAELLKQHSKLAWLGEFFTLKRMSSPDQYDFTLQQMLDMVDVEVGRIHARNPDSMVGHEIKPMNFLQNPSCNLIEYAQATANSIEYSHVVLRRRNVLRRICSSLKAAQTKVYHIRSDDNAYRNQQFAINFNDLRDYDTGQSADTFPALITRALAKEERVFANYRKVGITYLELTYEDDVEADPLAGYAKILGYLDLQFEPAQFSLKKTSISLRNELRNYDELEAQVSGSQYEWMLA